MYQIVTLFFIIFAATEAEIFKRSIENNHFLDQESNEINYNFHEIVKHKKYSSAEIDSAETFNENTNRNDGVKINYKLPNVVEVKKYTILLRVFLDEEIERNFAFNGIVDIDFDLKDRVDNITLHSDKLMIKSIILKQNGHEIEPLLDHYEKTDFLTVSVPKKKFESGHYSLKIKYNGTVSDDARGLFKSSYVNKKNETK